MAKTTPLIKGAITGTLILLVTLALYYSKTPANSPMNYIVYAIYAGGIAWTLYDYANSAAYTGKFGDAFSQGFRCFIIVTLIMVTFTGIFSSMHPEIAEEAATYYRADLVKEGNKTPVEIEEMVTKAKKQFTTGNISMAIFGYLITGALFTAAGAGLLIMRRK